MLTAAAQPGVSSLQHLFAGEYQHRIRVAVNNRPVLDKYVNYMVRTAHDEKIQSEPRPSLRQPASLYP